MRKTSQVGATTRGAEERLVRVSAGQVVLEGSLALPEHARGVVLFAHGSGSSRATAMPRMFFTMAISGPC